MLPLEHLELSHKGIIEEYIPDCCRKICDFTFGNLYCWSAAEHTEIAVEGGFLYLRATFNGVTSYAVPWGTGDMNRALARIEDDAGKRKADLSFCCIAEEQLPLLKLYFGDKLIVTEQRDYFDYVYSAEKLALLSGRKFHSKKNHVNSFMKKNKFTVEAMNDDNLGECLKFSHSWHMMNESNQRLEAERQVIDRAFSNYDELGFDGILIRIDGNIVAYALGEPMADGDTFCTHFEKASPEYSGAYAVVNKLFAERLSEKYRYINREDDAGVDGLRKAKLSYQPEYLVKKYYAKVI